MLALRYATKNEVDRLSKEQKVKVAEAQELGRENVSLKARNDALVLQVGQLRSQMAYEECKAAQRLQEQREQSQAEHERQRKQMHEQLVSERHNAQELIDATNARWRLSASTLRTSWIRARSSGLSVMRQCARRSPARMLSVWLHARRLFCRATRCRWTSCCAPSESSSPTSRD